MGAGSPKAELLGTFEMDGGHKSAILCCMHPSWKKIQLPTFGWNYGEGNEDKDEDNKVIQFLILQLSLAYKWKNLT